jgi:hypothetical protein
MARFVRGPMEGFPVTQWDTERPYPIHDYKEPGLSPQEKMARARGAVQDFDERIRRVVEWNAKLQKMAIDGAAYSKSVIAVLRERKAEAEREASGQRRLF